MLKKALCFNLLLVCTLSLSYEGIQLPGIIGSMDSAIINDAKNVYLSTFLEAINNMPLPDVSSRTLRLKRNKLVVDTQANDVEFVNDPATNSFTLNVKDLKANFKSERFEFDLTGLFWLPITGHATGKMSDIQLGLKLQMIT